MRLVYSFLCFIVISLSTAGITEGVKQILVYDEKISKKNISDTHNPYPRRFRTTSAPLKGEINVQGLKNLRASASGQFTQDQLQRILTDVITQQDIHKNEFILIDLRQEPHLFANGKPFSLFSRYFTGNAGQTAEQVLSQEKNLKEQLQGQDLITFYTVLKKGKDGQLGTTQQSFQSKPTLMTEEELAKQLGIRYVRLAVPDHQYPCASSVEAFIHLVQTLPSTSWLHFHCRGGSGRSSTFLLMYDIIKNGKNVPLADLMQRQITLGGKDLDKENKKSAFLNKGAEDRQQFIHHFYKYVTARDGLGHHTWSQWLKNHPLPLLPQKAN